MYFDKAVFVLDNHNGIQDNSVDLLNKPDMKKRKLLQKKNHENTKTIFSPSTPKSRLSFGSFYSGRLPDTKEKLTKKIYLFFCLKYLLFW